jgi:glucose/arabinose dehydrogenase
MKKILLFFFALTLLPWGCGKINPPSPKFLSNKKIDLETIKLPPGFKIELYAQDVENARSMDLSPSGTLFVGTRSKGSIYALTTKNNGLEAGKLYTIAEDMNMPNGVAYKDGNLYVAEVNRILKYSDIESRFKSTPSYDVIFDQYPKDRHHGWKYIDFGPDGKLYVPVGAPCNICDEEDPVYASITRINPDGSDLEIVHRGIRNTVGFTWHPQTKELWFTDNGRDMLGDEIPACEVNHAPRDSMHFGYPYCHQGDLPDPEFGEKYPCSDFTPPAKNLGPHTAPLGIEFYTGTQFPENYRNQIFVAEHGSWNRSKKIGYRVMMLKLQDDEVISYEPFAEGWLNEENDKIWGRPVDLELLPDGSMLVSDDYADVIYRIYYEGED